jgi:uncharacterized membrane protein YphA (DoxX/SURF4 family)
MAARRSPRPPSASGFARAAGYFGGALLGAVLLFAASTKAIHPNGFVAELEGLKLGLPITERVLAFAVLGLEFLLGSLLILGVRRWWVLGPATLLVLAFLGITGREYYRAAQGLATAEHGCGCFGSLIERTPKEAFFQDLLLLVPTLALAFVARPGGATPRRRALSALAVTVAGLLLAWRAPALPLDDWATRARPGVALSDLCAGRDADRVCLDALAPELDSGEHFLIVADLADEAFVAEVPRLSEWVIAEDGPPLVVLTAAGPEERQAFYWRAAPAFEPRQAPAALLGAMVRRFPRSFLVRDGVILASFDGLPPLAAGTDPATSPPVPMEKTP